MRLTVLGSADAFMSAGRAHSSYWIHGERPVVVDFGASSLMRVRQLGLRPSDIGGLAITHLHGDHIGGLPFLWIDGMYHERRDRPLELVGPVGLRARLVELLEVTYAHAARIDWMPHQITEIAPGESAELCGLRIRGFAAEHMDPPERPLCLRVEGEGVVAFSGDTELCDGLFDAARGADLLVAECSSLAPPAGRHSTWEGWKAAFHRMEARRLVLTHLGDDVRGAIERLKAEAPQGLDLSFAEDGAEYEIA